MNENKMKSEMGFPYRGAMNYETHKENIKDYQTYGLDYPHILGVDIVIAL